MTTLSICGAETAEVDHQRSSADDDDDLDPKYTSICSQRTVQSTDCGFFHDLFDNVRNACPAQWLHGTFARQPDHVARIRCLFANGGPGAELIAVLANVQPVFKPKDARFSMQRRRDGERLCDESQWERALVMLSLAVMRAPPTGS